jgi:hypothetical protein
MSIQDRRPGVIYQVVAITAILLFVLSSCRSPARPTSPPSRSFASPVSQITFHTTLTLGSKEAPDDHWVGFFGGSVDINGDVLVTGEPFWGHPPGEGVGAAYVFRKTSEGGWQLEATLLPSDRNSGFQEDQHFGEVIALQGTLVAVGAPGADNPVAGDDTGAVYIYEFDGRNWVETEKLVSSRQQPGEKFGSALALDGDLMAVAGAPGAGIIDIFRRELQGWLEMSQIPVSATLEKEKPYVLVDLLGNTLALSTVTPYDLEEPDPQKQVRSLKRTGIVTLYELSGAQWAQVFQTPAQEASLYRISDGPYGLPIALGGEAGQASLLAIGKPGFPESGREKGSVLIYERGEAGWTPQAELFLAPGEQVPGILNFWPNPGATFFGAAVAFDQSRLAVISTFANTVYVFEPQEADWAYQFRITPGQIGDTFQRRTAAMSGDQLLLGSPGELGGGYIFVFDLAPQDNE